MAGKQMHRPGDAPVAVLWDMAFIPSAFQIVLGFGRHQSKYVSSFFCLVCQVCHIHLWIQSILLLKAKGAKIPAMTRQISNNQIVFGKNVDRTGLNSQ